MKNGEIAIRARQRVVRAAAKRPPMLNEVVSNHMDGEQYVTGGYVVRPTVGRSSPKDSRNASGSDRSSGCRGRGGDKYAQRDIPLQCEVRDDTSDVRDRMPSIPQCRSKEGSQLACASHRQSCLSQPFPYWAFATSHTLRAWRT